MGRPLCRPRVASSARSTGRLHAGAIRMLVRSYFSKSARSCLIGQHLRCSADAGRYDADVPRPVPPTSRCTTMRRNPGTDPAGATNWPPWPITPSTCSHHRRSTPTVRRRANRRCAAALARRQAGHPDNAIKRHGRRRSRHVRQSDRRHCRSMNAAVFLRAADLLAGLKDRRRNHARPIRRCTTGRDRSRSPRADRLLAVQRRLPDRF